MKQIVMEKELHKGLLNWYEFGKKSNILCIEIEEILNGFLVQQNHRVLNISVDTVYKDVFIDEHQESFDYVIAIHKIEEVEEPVEFLKRLKKVLRNKGQLLLGTDNRLGLRYFCGERDPYTLGMFDGIENYCNVDRSGINGGKGRCYSKQEIENFLDLSEYKFRKFYSILPDTVTPQLIYSHDYLPRESLATRFIPLYRNNEDICMNENVIYDGLVRNNMFHQMANEYLVIGSKEKIELDVKHVTLSMDRGPTGACATIISTGNVVKKALYQEGMDGIRRLKENEQYLKEHGVKIVEGVYENNSYTMPYIEAPIASNYLQFLLDQQEVDLFIKRLDEFRQLIISSSDVVEINEMGEILERAYIDLVPLNCFWVDNHYLVYDQEFYLERIPANLMLWRAIIIIYDDNPARQSILPRETLFKRYNMERDFDFYARLSYDFLQKLRNQTELIEFNRKKGASKELIRKNRNFLDIGKNRMEKEILMLKNEVDEKNKKLMYSIDVENLLDEYRENCFDISQNMKVFVFGAGRYSDKFLAFYNQDYNICGILDNDENKWGNVFRGIQIKSPECLLDETQPYKVIICVKNYKPILYQLKNMGVRHIGIYDANYIYRGRQREESRIKRQDKKSKKYRVGYVSGVFDLFHIGHINMLRRAKEQCDYLIAAVTSDEYVRRQKNREPFIPFEERLEVVRACVYVDEAVGVPFEYAGTVEAFQKYHFDCQFCGSDYINDEWWLEQKRYLEEHGAALEFFPYTQQTSSSKIKALIEQKLV